MAVKTNNRNLIQKMFSIGEDGRVKIDLDIHSIPKETENRIIKETEEFIDSVYEILQKIDQEDCSESTLGNGACYAFKQN